MIKMGSFRSYVDLEEYEMKIPAPANGAFLQPRFIPGELVIAEATNVLKFTSLSKTKGLSGSLFVTNARVVFVSSDHVCSEDSFPLLCINTLWYYESNVKSSSSSTTASVKKTKRKIKLGAMKSVSNSSSSNLYNYSSSSSNHQSTSQNHLISSSGSTRVHEIFLVCSNFRTLRISFKFSPIDQGLRVCNAIIHHAFPDQLERLFYFDFCKSYTAQWTGSITSGGSTSSSGSISLGNRPLLLTIPSFMDKGDWLRELNVTRTAPGYRISGINEGFQLCGSLPEWIVVPSDLNDARVMNLAEKLKGCRPPHWAWGDSRGASILIMGKLNNEADSTAENAFFESLRKVHPNGVPPTICDLDTYITLKEIRQSFVALVDLCCPESLSQYQDADSKFYSLLEHTKWLLLLSKVLAKCRDVVDKLNFQANAIVFQEQEGRDISCLFSSLVQIIIDSRFRTVTGFFSLIQKDWVAFGHPFHSTHLHTSPVFLLFLDCVFQLQNQNPLDFEFNERLLGSLWDSSFDCTTGTFLFDSPQQRKSSELCKDYTAWASILSNANLDSPANSPSIPPSPAARVMQSRREMLAKQALPRALVNPFFQVKSLLSSHQTSYASGQFTTTSTSPRHNAQELSACSSTMCDIVFWESLYLYRTLETTPMIITSGEGLAISDPLLPGSNTGSPLHASPSPSPSSKFYFPLPSNPDGSEQKRRPGRDVTTELKVVEELLNNLTTSTRFQRNVSSSSGVSSSPSNVGGNSSGCNVANILQSKSSSSSFIQQRQHIINSSPMFRSRLVAGASSSPSSVTSSPILSSNSSRYASGTGSSSNSPRRTQFMNMTSTS